MKKDIVAVILAAGKGKRFWPFVTDKNLFPFLGKPLALYMADMKFHQSVSEVVFIANDTNKKTLQEMHMPVPHSVVVQKSGGGMADALMAAQSKIKGKRLLVIIGDDVTDQSVMFQTVKKAESGNYACVLPVWHVQTYYPGGYIRFRGERPIEIIEKPAKGKEPSAYVDFGGQYIRDADAFITVLSHMSSARDDVYERALSQLMATQECRTIPISEPFVSLKYPWHVLDVNRYFLSHRLAQDPGKKVLLKHNVTIEGTVHFGNNVRVFENTKIIGPCFIGDNTIIGSNNILRESSIGKNCVTGFNTDITRSYIGDDCWFHSNYIGDSVIEGNVSMGAGTVCANLRLDEGEVTTDVHGIRIGTDRTKLGVMIAKNVRIGVNVSLMPGIKVGQNSYIGAGVTLNTDLPDDSYCTAVNGYSVKKNNSTVSLAEHREQYKKRI